MKPTDKEAEAVARRVLARKLGMLLQEQVPFIEGEAKRKRPDLEVIRSTCFTIYEGMDAELSKYDRKHGTQREKAASKIWLRVLLGRQIAHSDLSESDVKFLQTEVEKRDALLANAVRIVESLVALCKSHGVPIPPWLMGEPPQ